MGIRLCSVGHGTCHPNSVPRFVQDDVPVTLLEVPIAPCQEALQHGSDSKEASPHEPATNTPWHQARLDAEHKSTSGDKRLPSPLPSPERAGLREVSGECIRTTPIGRPPMPS